MSDRCPRHPGVVVSVVYTGTDAISEWARPGPLHVESCPACNREKSKAKQRRRAEYAAYLARRDGIR